MKLLDDQVDLVGVVDVEDHVIIAELVKVKDRVNLEGVDDIEESVNFVDSVDSEG